jgi:hypothetical protein
MPAMIEPWPELSYATWQDTCTGLHLRSQIIGKLRLAKTPWVNHSWHVALYVTPRGLSTSAIPEGNRSFEILFDFIAHRVRIETSDGGQKSLALQPQSIADFYAQVRASLKELGIEVRIHDVPNEIPDAIPFTEDRTVRDYNREHAEKFWHVVSQADRVFKHFRSGFLGKVSPVHFFWGSFDLAVTRFSGRRAPERPGADSITREAYSHEVSSAGFWPGGGDIKGPAFYSYAAPEPPGFAEQRVGPPEAFYHAQMKEFLLMYDDVRTAASPKGALIEFLQSTYNAAADLGKWDRKSLER